MPKIGIHLNFSDLVIDDQNPKLIMQSILFREYINLLILATVSFSNYLNMKVSHQREVIQQNQIFCPDGVIKICQMFRKQTVSAPYIIDQQHLYREIDRIKSEDPIKKHLTEIYYFLNGYYLLSKTLHEIIHENNDQLNNVGDKKVIKVIFKTMIITHLKSFKNHAIWRPESMEKFIKLINVKIQNLIDDLKLQKIMMEDLEGLYSMKAVFQVSENKKTYQKIGAEIQKGDVDIQIQTIFDKFKGYYYEYLGKNTNQKNSRAIECLKILFRFLKYINRQHPQITYLNPVSKIYFLWKRNGYQVFENFCNEASLSQIEKEKQMEKKYREKSHKNIVQDSQDSHHPTEQSKEDKIIIISNQNMDVGIPVQNQQSVLGSKEDKKINRTK